MKAVLFNTSPRHQGNTFQMLTTIDEIFKTESIETEIVQIGGKALNGCRACYTCKEKRNMKCSLNDAFNDYFKKMAEADVIIIGSPTYVADITPEAKALIDRSCIVNRANGGVLKRKLGAAVIPVRRAGSVHAFDSINHFFLISEMIIAGSLYWNMSLARDIGEYQNDEEGLKTMKTLAENIVWVLKKVK